MRKFAAFGRLRAVLVDPLSIPEPSPVGRSSQVSDTATDAWGLRQERTAVGRTCEFVAGGSLTESCDGQPAFAKRRAWFSAYRGIIADHGGNRPHPAALVSRVQAVPLCCVPWVYVKPRLAPAAVRGFRLELVSEQNPIHFSYRPLGP